MAVIDTSSDSWVILTKDMKEKTTKINNVTTIYYIVTTVKENKVTGQQVKSVVNTLEETEKTEVIKEGKGVDLSPKTNTFNMTENWAGPSEGSKVPPTKSLIRNLKQQLSNLSLIHI